MKLLTDDLSSWFGSLDDVKPEYIPVHVWNILQFYKMKSRTTTMIKDNIEPITNIQYVIFSPKENKYYLREFRNYSLDAFYFYRRMLDFSGEDTNIEQLRRYVDDDNVWLLYTPDMIKEMQVMLARVWRSKYSDEGMLKYRIFIDLLDNNLKHEDYKEYSRNLTGFKTVCRKFELTNETIWEEARKASK